MILPKSYVIKEELKEQIINGTFKKNKRFLSVKELIQKYQLSLATSHKILQELGNEGFVSIKRGIGTFVRDFTSEIQPPGNKIVFVTFDEDLTSQFYLNYLNGARKEFSNRNCSLIYEWISINERKRTFNQREFNTLKSKLFLMKKNNEILGIVFTGIIFKNFLTELKELNIPFVVIGDLAEPEISNDMDLVGVDNYHYAYKAVEYLINTNHKRIGCIAIDQNYSWWKERLRGYKKAIEDTGYTVDNELIIKTKTCTLKEGYSSMEQLIKLKSRPTAVFCFDDTHAIGAMKANFDYGIKVPDNMSILGFSDFDETEYTIPSLTVIRQFPQKMGRMAMKILLNKINNKNNHKEHRITVEARLIKRDSCKRVS